MHRRSISLQCNVKTIGKSVGVIHSASQYCQDADTGFFPPCCFSAFVLSFVFQLTSFIVSGSLCEYQAFLSEMDHTPSLPVVSFSSVKKPFLGVSLRPQGLFSRKQLLCILPTISVSRNGTTVTDLEDLWTCTEITGGGWVLGKKMKILFETKQGKVSEHQKATTQLLVINPRWSHGSCRTLRGDCYWLWECHERSEGSSGPQRRQAPLPFGGLVRAARGQVSHANWSVTFTPLSFSFLSTFCQLLFGMSLSPLLLFFLLTIYSLTD